MRTAHRRLASLVACLALMLTLTLTATRAAAQQCQQAPSPLAPPPSSGPDESADPVPLATCIYRVSVTPDGGMTQSWPVNTAGHTATFIAKNTGSGGANDAFDFTCTGTAMVTVSCTTVTPSSQFLAQGDSTTVTVTYGVGGTTGTGRLTLKATGNATAASDTGYYAIPISSGPASVTVTPDNGAGLERAASSTANSETFTVRNTGSSPITYALTCGATGQVTCVTTALGFVTIAASASAPVSVNYNAGTTGLGTLTLTATGGGASDAGSYTVKVVNPPSVSVVGVPFDDQDLGRCAVGCFQAGAAQSTTPYFSLGAPRAVTLVYRQDRAHPRPFIHADVQDVSAPSAGVPVRYWLQAQLDGAQVTFVNGEQTLRFSYPGGFPPAKVRLGGQFDGNGLSNGVHALTVTVTAEYSSGGTIQTTQAASLTGVNEGPSAIAHGWTLGGIQRLRFQTTGAVLLTDGAGSAVVFGKNGSGQYVSPTGEFSQLVAEKSGTTITGYTRRFADSTRVWFDVSGKMTKVTDAFTNATLIGYDGSGRVQTITDPMTRAVTLGYDANGLHTITDPGGRVTTVTVQSTKLLTAITDPDGRSTGYGYDTHQRLATITNRAGNVTTVGYGEGWELATVTAPAVTVFGSGTPQAPVTQVRAWQVAGVPFAATATTPFAPPGSDTVYASITEPGAAVARMTVDRWGQPLRQINATGDTTKVSYDSYGLVSTVILPTYTATEADSVLHAANGLTQWMAGAGRPGVSVRYGPYAQPDSIYGAPTDSVPVQRPYVGVNGRIDSIRVAGTIRQRTTYDSRGRVDSIVDGKQQFVVRYHYDAASGNVDTVTTPGGLKTAVSYDAFGRPTTVKAPGVATQTTYYSNLNRVDSVKTSDGGTGRTVRYSYDALFLRSVTDPKGQVDSLFYNALGWTTSERDPAGGVLQSAYSLDGDLKQWTNRRGQAITLSYDALHRPTQKSGTNTDLVTWSYSAPSARFVTVASPVSTETTYLNVRGQADSAKTVTAGQTFWRRYRYRRTGQVVTDTISGGGIANWQARQYAYDAKTALLKSIQVGSQLTAFRRDTNLDVQATALPGGETDSTTLGPLRSPLDERTTAPYAATTDRLFSLDRGYRVQQQFKNLTPAQGRFFQYDSLGQLVSGADKHWTGALPGNCLNLVFGYNCQQSGTGWTTDNATTYSYDLAGNRTSQGGTYGAANRITAMNGCTYSTDADGNVTGRTCPGAPALTATFAWTAEGQLRSATSGGQTTTFDYDAGGRLMEVDSAGIVYRRFLWEGPTLLAHLSGTATAKRAEYSYYPGLDALQAVVRNDTLFFAHTDGVGSVIALTDVQKTVQRTFAYDDWGLGTGGTDAGGFGGTDRPRWQGALWMSVAGGDLYYMRARWYEPQTGRFLSEDPAGLAGGLNAYTFADDDPVNGSDPSGMCPPEDDAPCLGELTVFGHRAPGNPETALINHSGCFLARSMEDDAWHCKFGAVDMGNAVAWPHALGSTPHRPVRPTYLGEGGGGRALSRTPTVGNRSTEQCFRENTAPVTNLLRSAAARVSTAAFAAVDLTLAAGGLAARAQGNALVAKGTVDLDLFFAMPKASSSLIEGGIETISIGRGYVTTGSALLGAGVAGAEILGAAAGIGAVYYGVSYGICSVNPEY
ncbi:MAG TPA: RHS repeat-associated core domain-containing protein [Gemmatimonadales bacterium]|nr:RHS repeat-associated core domain-containing protein [Gemmatimonadales bacterium]